MAGGLGGPGPPSSGRTAGESLAVAYAAPMPADRGRRDARFYLTAAPSSRVEVPTLYEPGGVLAVLEEPPTLRAPTHGWDLWTLDTPELVEGRKAILVNGYRKRLALYNGGSLVFVAGLIEFLAWPRSPAQFVHDPALNGIGLIELAYNFGLTFAEVREHMVLPPDRVQIWSGFRDLSLADGARVYLEVGLGEAEDADAYEAPSPAYDSYFALEWSDDFAASVAFQLVVKSFSWFGVEAGAIPFVDHEQALLDHEALRAHLTGRGRSTEFAVPA